MGGRLSDYRLKRVSKLRECGRACDGEKSTRYNQKTCFFWFIVRSGNGTTLQNKRVRVAALLWGGSIEKTGKRKRFSLEIVREARQ